MRVSLARRTSDGTIATAALEIIAPLTLQNEGPRIREINITLATAVASVFGLGRPAAKGITPTTPVKFLMENAGDQNEPQSTTAIAWGTGPTVPAQFFRRVGFPATIGTYIKWTFDKGLLIPAGGTIVLWNITANGLVDVDVTMDEN